MNNDDIAARIVLAIETANALEQCQTLEEALTRITEARERDNSVAKTGVQVDNAASVSNIEEETSAIEKRTEARKADNTEKKTSESSAPDNSATISAIQAETQAIKERAEARKAEASQNSADRKQSFAEIHGMSEEEYERMARANREASERARAEQDRLWQEQKNRQNQAQSEEPIDPKREAAIDALRKRKDILQDLEAAHEAYSSRTKAEIEEEIAGQKKIIAHLKKRIALRKKLELEHKLDSVKADLSMPDVKGDPEKLLSTLNLRDKLQNQLVGAEMEVLNAENAIKNLDEVNDVLNNTRDAAKGASSLLAPLARNVIKTFRAIFAATGRSMGIDVSAEGLGVGGAKGGKKGFLAGGSAGMMAAGGMAIGGLMAFWRSYQQFSKEEEQLRRDAVDQLVSINAEVSQRVAEVNKEWEKNLSTLREIRSPGEMSNVQRFEQENIIEKLNRRFENLIVNIDKASGKILNLGEVEEAVFKKNTEDAIAAKEREYQTLQNEALMLEREMSSGLDFINQLVDKESPRRLQEINDKLSKLQPELNKLYRSLETEATKKRAEKREAEKADVEEKINKQLRQNYENLYIEMTRRSGQSQKANRMQLAMEATNLMRQQGWSKAQAQEWLKIQQIMRFSTQGFSHKSIIGELGKYRQTSQQGTETNTLEALRMQSRVILQPQLSQDNKMLQISQKQNATLGEIKKILDAYLKNRPPTENFEFVEI